MIGKRFWTIPATLAAIGLALALGGCPIDVDNRETDGFRGGNFGGSPTAPVTVRVTGIPTAVHSGDQISVWIDGHSNQYVSLINGSFTATWSNADISVDRAFGFWSTTFSATFNTAPMRLVAGENVISWSQFTNRPTGTAMLTVNGINQDDAFTAGLRVELQGTTFPATTSWWGGATFNLGSQQVPMILPVRIDHDDWPDGGALVTLVTFNTWATTVNFADFRPAAGPQQVTLMVTGIPGSLVGETVTVNMANLDGSIIVPSTTVQPDGTFTVVTPNIVSGAGLTTSINVGGLNIPLPSVMPGINTRAWGSLSTIVTLHVYGIPSEHNGTLVTGGIYVDGVTSSFTATAWGSFTASTSAPVATTNINAWFSLGAVNVSIPLELGVNDRNWADLPAGSMVIYNMPGSFQLLERGITYAFLEILRSDSVVATSQEASIISGSTFFHFLADEVNNIGPGGFNVRLDFGSGRMATRTGGDNLSGFTPVSWGAFDWDTNLFDITTNLNIVATGGAPSGIVRVGLHMAWAPHDEIWHFEVDFDGGEDFTDVSPITTWNWALPGDAQVRLTFNDGLGGTTTISSVSDPFFSDSGTVNMTWDMTAGTLDITP